MLFKTNSHRLHAVSELANIIKSGASVSCETCAYDKKRVWDVDHEYILEEPNECVNCMHSDVNWEMSDEEAAHQAAVFIHLLGWIKSGEDGACYSGLVERIADKIDNFGLGSCETCEYKDEKAGNHEVRWCDCCEASSWIIAHNKSKELAGEILSVLDEEVPEYE